MPIRFSEEEVRQFIHSQGLEPLIDDVLELGSDQTEVPKPAMTAQYNADDEITFELWRVIKAGVLEKLGRLHREIRYGDIIGSKIKLPTDSTVPMELDFLGHYDGGAFVLELKVNRSAERNAFSELLAYSNYIAEMFMMSGPNDIANVLIAPLSAKITKHAFLYDLLIADRKIIIYKPEFPGNTLENLKLRLYIPSDDEFKYFTNDLLSHSAMSCVVASFHDAPGWIDSTETDGTLGAETITHLEALSSYSAQLMEAEHLHGFCFVRKPWQEMPRYYRNSLFICAVNPFRLAQQQRADPLIEQLGADHIADLVERSERGFRARLLVIARRAISDGLTHGHRCELEMPHWNMIVETMHEVVFTHNLGFRPTGIMREAYVNYLNAVYARNESDPESATDVEHLKSDEVFNWSRAWEFMELCGFSEVDPTENGS